MTQVNYIKELREREGESISQIAGRVGICWSTAKKYADDPVRFDQQPKRRRKRTVMDEFEEYVDAWLLEDLYDQRKNRRTAKSIYETLYSLGYRGSDRTVRDYVRDKRQVFQRERRERTEQFVRLEHPCGEAQVDFGEFEAIDPFEGMIITLFHLVASFPNSNTRFARILPAQNSECLFYGLYDMFLEMGGVPPYILFDNLTPVVKTIVSPTERELTTMFKDFQQWFGFESIFCAPGCGHHKGNVENAVGYVRRNFLIPKLRITDYGEANGTLQEQLVDDRESLHYEKNKPIKELWEEDRAVLLPLPEAEYQPVRSTLAKVNKYGEISINKGKERYHLPTAHPKQQVFVQLGWNSVRVYDSHGETLVSEQSRDYILNKKEIDWAATLAIYVHRPRAVEQATCLKALPDELKSFLLSDNVSGRRTRIRTLMRLFEEHDMATVKAVVVKGIALQTTEQADLCMIAELLTVSESAPPLEDSWTPANAVDWMPNLGAYDALAPRGGGDE